MNLQVSPSNLHAVAEACEPPHRQPRRQRLARPFESDASYFQRRAGEERAFADRLVDERARALHLELADRYAGLSAAINEAEEQIG